MTKIYNPDEMPNPIKNPLGLLRDPDTREHLSAFFNSKTRKTMDPLDKLGIGFDIMEIAAGALLIALYSPASLPYAGFKKLKEKRAHAKGMQPA